MKQLLFLFLVTLANKCLGFKFLCPHPSHWNSRAIEKCGAVEKYFCLQSGTEFMEGCSGPHMVQYGIKAVYSDNFDTRNCNENRYQPFSFTTERYSECAIQKSVCEEEGQITVSEGTTIGDSTCRCDHKKGYAYINQTRKACWCIPSEEDCSCFLSPCMNQTHKLSSGYQCISIADKDVEDQCALSAKNIDNNNANMSRKLDVVQQRHKGTLLSAQNCAKAVLIIIVLTIVVLVCYEFVELPFILQLHRDMDKLEPLLEGDKLCLRVDIYGIGKPNIIFWEFKGREQHEWQHIAEGNCTKGCFRKSCNLPIKDLRKRHSGTYRCSIPNIFHCLSSDVKKEVNIYSGEKAKIIDRTKLLIDQHSKDEKFFQTSAAIKAIKLLEKANFLLVTGREGIGKSKLCIDIGRHFRSERYCVFHLSKPLTEYLPTDEHSLKELYIFDINEIKRAHDFIDRVKSNTKIVVTVLTDDTDDLHDISEFETTDRRVLNLDEIINEDKQGILDRYFVDPLSKQITDEILNAELLIGFPRCCEHYYSTDKSSIGRSFYQPPQSLVNQIDDLRSSSDFTRLEYTVLVYTLILGRVELDNLNMELLRRLEDEFLVKVTGVKVTDAAKSLSTGKNKHKFMKKLKDREYSFRLEAFRRAVLISYSEVNLEWCVDNCDWQYIEEIVRPLYFPAFLKQIYIKSCDDKLFSRLQKHASNNEESAMQVVKYISSLRYHGGNIVDKFCTFFNEMTLDTFKETFTGVLFVDEFTKSWNYYKNCAKFFDLLTKKIIDEKGNCFLHYIVLKNYEDLAKFIVLKFGEYYFMNCLNRQNSSPCHLAVFLGRSCIFMALKEGIPKIKEEIDTLCDLEMRGRKHLRCSTTLTPTAYFKPPISEDITGGETYQNIGQIQLENHLKSEFGEMYTNMKLKVELGNKEDFNKIEHVVFSLKRQMNQS